jgi:hypothetical protein
MQGTHQLVDLRDPLLEEVPEPLDAVGEECVATARWRWSGSATVSSRSMSAVSVSSPATPSRTR